MNENTFINDVQAAARYGVSRTTPWRWASEGNFPKPIKLSPGWDRKSVVEGKSVDLGGRRIIKKKKIEEYGRVRWAAR